MQKLIAKFLVIVIILQIINPINFIGDVFAVSSTVSYALTATDQLDNGNIWNNPSDSTWDTSGTSSDSNVATKNDFTNLLLLNNFNLSASWLPAWSTINWIQVDVQRQVGNKKMVDSIVQLTKNWLSGIWNNYANNAGWPTTLTTTTYGSLGDLWWTTWTVDELFDSNFWVILQYENTLNKTYTVNVHKVGITIDYTPNNIPTDILLSNQSIPSALPIWSLVWSLTTTDADVLDTHTYDFNCNTPWIDDFSFSILGTDLNSNEVFDNTVKSSYDICIRTDDWRTGIFDKNFTITITDPLPNNPPTDITLSNNTILEFTSIWTLVWTLTTTDTDSSDNHTYSTSCSIAWLDDSSFSVNWLNLESNEVFDQSIKSSYDICIRTDDGRWGIFDKNFNITVVINLNIWYAWLSTDIWLGDSSWVNPSNAEWNTTNTFTVSSIATRDDLSNYLSLTDFNLISTWLSPDSVINGIQVDVERNVSDTKVLDTVVQLTKDWTTLTWNNNATNTAWPLAKTITTYGSLVDLWGITWTGADLLSSNFWVILQYTNTKNLSQDVNIYRVNITIDYSTPDLTDPTLSIIFPLENGIIPNSNFNIDYSYDDLESWIDVLTANIQLFRWNWVDWGTDISATYIDVAWATIVSTWASYSTLTTLWFWKYKSSFTIDDNAGNQSLIDTIFYVDQPKMIISTWSANIWILNDLTNTFTWDITITVETIWAPFRVKLQKNITLTANTEIIPYYDWSKWFGYDKNNDWNLFDYNDDIIWQEVLNINTNWDLNTYVYTVKMWAIIDNLQSAWNYEWRINFGIELDY